MHALIGRPVVFYDQSGTSHYALVTEVHDESEKPMVSVVYVDRDPELAWSDRATEATSVPPTGETYTWERRGEA